MESSTPMRTLRSFIAILLVSSGAACAKPAGPSVPVGTTETTSTSVSPQPSQFRQTSPNETVAFALTTASLGASMDAEDIAAVVRAIVDTQLGESRLAAERARDGRVRQIAAHAAHDFGKADETLNTLQSLEPFDVEDTAASKSLRAASGMALEHLRSASADDFDREYVAAAIVTRGRLIEVLDRMAGQADPTLKRGLVELRSTLADALRDAREAAAQLARERT
jgi:hypothetical protein